MEKGRIIFLNGVTSAGKTSIVESLQSQEDIFFYVVANDLFQEMVGENYLHTNYWKYLSDVIIMMYHTAKLYSDMGKNVLIDGILVEREEIKPHYHQLLEILKDNPLDIVDYKLFQGMPTKVLTDHDIIDIGGREIEVLHTPGHSPGHLCFWEKSRGYLFTGDLVYKDILFAYYPSTDPEAYLDSLEKVAALPVKKVFPAHHSLDIKPEILIRMRDAFRSLKADGKLHHESGTFQYGDWGVWL